MRTLSSALVLLCVGLVASAAPADANEAIAHERFTAATKLHEQGEYEAAMRAFEQAFDLGGPPVCLYNAANSAERAARFERAVELWRRYERLVQGNERALANKRLQALLGRRSKVTISSDPEGAQVFVDGQQRGLTTPTTLDLPPGRHVIRLRLDDHEPASRAIELRFGRPAMVDVRLSPQSHAARLVVASSPSGEVILDGVALGKTPLQREVAPGSRRLVIRADGYAAHTEQIELKPRGQVSVKATLVPSRQRSFAATATVGAVVPIDVAGLGTGFDAELHLRMEPWRSLPLAIALNVAVSPIEGGVILTIAPCVSATIPLPRVLTDRVSLRTDLGVGYATARVSGSPLFTAGHNGTLNGVALLARVTVEVVVAKHLLLSVTPIGVDVIPGALDFETTVTRLRFGGGLGAQLGW